MKRCERVKNARFETKKTIFSRLQLWDFFFRVCDKNIFPSVEE